jgi:diaminopimelate epimerase
MRLTKHHGLGNDFLVLLDLDDTSPVAPATAVALCDRHTGVGADGLLRVTAGTGDADVTMELLNADGSVAEMSGNGIRCLAQAVFHAGIVTPPVLRVATLAGLRTVTEVGRTDGRTQRLSVEMGQAKVVGEEPEWAGGRAVRATRVDVGNPHLVIQWADHDLPGDDVLVAIGSSIDRATPGGSNVELVRPGPNEGELTMVVFERGVGPTRACGTGACAVAAAAQEWNLTESHAVVHMPGGPVEITLGDPVLLIGDATFVATIDVPQI